MMLDLIGHESESVDISLFRQGQDGSMSLGALARILDSGVCTWNLLRGRSEGVILEYPELDRNCY